LEKYELRFQKKSADGSAKCDAFETGSASDAFIGVLYTIPQDQERALDDCEGLGKGYDKKKVTLTTEDGSAFQAMTYIATSIDPTLKPYTWYKEFVEWGAREHKLPAAYIQRFISSVEAKPDCDKKRQEKKRAEVK